MISKTNKAIDNVRMKDIEEAIKTTNVTETIAIATNYPGEEI